MVKSFFSQSKVTGAECKDIVFSMVRILAQKEGDAVSELLGMICPYFGEESVLSVVESSYRDIISTTESQGATEALKKTAASIKDVENRRHYFREEKNGIFFRIPHNCVRIIPFREMGERTCFLMVEQAKSIEPGLDRCIEVLEIAVRMELYEYVAQKNASMDFKTKLPTRDLLVKKLREMEGTQCFLGMFYLLNGDDIGLAEGIAGLDRVLYDVSRVVERFFSRQCYMVADRKLAVWSVGSMFEIASRLQLCMDAIVSQVPDAKMGCVLSPMVDEIYRAMYLCERACEDVSKDTVLVIRNPEEYLNTGGEVMELVYIGQSGEEVKEGSSEGLKEGPVFNENKDAGGAVPDDEIFTYDWEGGFDKMESYEGL